MAKYYKFDEGFERGVTPLLSTGKGAFTSKLGSGASRMSFPGPRQLALDGYRIGPYRGGGICRCDFTRTDADAYLLEDTAFDLAGTSTMNFMIMVFPYMLNLSSPDDGFDIFRGISSGPVTTYAARVTWEEPQGLVLALQGQTVPLPESTWTAIEGEVKAGAGGYVKLFVGGSTLNYAPTTVAAITDFHLGVLGQTGTITQGSICFDEILVPTVAARMYPPQGPMDALHLDGASLRMRRSGFAFVGPGEILSLQLTGIDGTDAKVQVYDTATPNFSESDLVEVITVVTQGLTKTNQRILKFNRGAWLEISGGATTDPLVVMQLGQITEMDYYSDFGGDVDEDDDNDNKT